MATSDYPTSFGMVAFQQNQDTGGVLTLVNSVPDQSALAGAQKFTVPDWADTLAAVLAIGANITLCQVQSPNLRKEAFVDVSPLNVNAAIQTPTPMLDMWNRPRDLANADSLSVLVAESAAGAETETVFCWLKGADRPLPEGDIRTIRMTATTAAVANAWTLEAPVITQQLESGRYELCGLRGESATMLACRAVFDKGGGRPGVPGATGPGVKRPDWTRYGGLGQGWGSFVHTNPPQFEVFCTGADAAFTFYVDVIRTGDVS